MCTDSGNLRCNEILHLVIPKYNKDKHLEANFKALRKAMRAVFEKAKQFKTKTLALALPV